MAKLLACLAAALVLATAARAVTVGDFFSDPKFEPFAAKALATSCITDPAVSSGAFDLDECPSLLGMLDALFSGATDYPVECEESCAATFYALTDTCLTELTAAFNADPAPVGVLGSDFLAECAVVHSGGDAAGPSPSMPPTIAPAPMRRRL